MRPAGRASTHRQVAHILLWLLFALAAGGVRGGSIARTITVDGTFTDWTSPTNILTNPGQFSSDGQGDPPGSVCPGSTDLDAYDTKTLAGTCVGLPGGVGRDLRKFTFTFDGTNLYFYVERFASSTNVTDWWFYVDRDNDAKMETGEPVYRVSWQGSTRNTDRELWDYTPANALGDPLIGGSPPRGDGYTMPGSIGNRRVLTNVTGGSVSGLQMETFVSWADICGAPCTPRSIRFHVSSSNGSNLPNNIVDNIDGPGGSGGVISIIDLAVAKTASVSSIVGETFRTFQYTVSVTNVAGGPATGVKLTDLLPATVIYRSHTAPTGTSYTVGTGLWSIPTLPNGATRNLVITVSPTAVTSTTLVTNTAGSLVLNEWDPNGANNSASVDVTLTPKPNLTITKAASPATDVQSLDVITYTVTIQNTGPGDAINVLAEDDLSHFTSFGIDSFGPGLPFQFTEIVGPTGLSLGTPGYSSDEGISFGYGPLASGSNGAESGYDGLVTHWQIPMIGTMAVGTSFRITYRAQVRRDSR